MPAFHSPLVDPAGWTYTIATVSIAAGLRYGGYALRGVRATRAAGTVQMPATGVLRRVTPAGGPTTVEVQVLPTSIRAVVAAIPGGLPTFYLVFPDDAGLTFSDHQAAPGGETLRPAMDVTIACGFDDRIVRDPALWASAIEAAIAAGGGTVTEWEPFADALNAAINTGPSAPVLVLSHDGVPLGTGSVDVVFGAPGTETVHTIALDPLDGGDLQRAVARLNAAGTLPIADLWGGGAASFRLRPVGGAGADFQLSRVEDRATAAGEIPVTPAARHVLFTNLVDWYAPQAAVPVAAVASPLARYTRGNLVTPLVNGPEYFDDLFVQLRDAATAGGGFHLTGWAMFPQTRFVRRQPGDDPHENITLARAEEEIGADNVPLTLEQAASRIAAGGGSCRFLPAQHLQLEPGAVVDEAVILSALLFIGGLIVLDAKGVNFARMDTTGLLLLLGAWSASTVVIGTILDSGGEPIQPTKDAVNVLNPIAQTESRYSPYPATIADNPLAPAPDAVPLNIVFDVVRHFGVYHQKFGIVRTAAGHVGYCGGIDLNPDRLDDLHHLIKSPFHDVHARVEGPAVFDLATSFAERWQRDGGGTGPAFTIDDPGTLGTPGNHIVQVARTYFRAAAPERQLEFAPNGDDTLNATMLLAIAQAREFIYIEEQYLTAPAAYRNALVAKVASGTLRKLVIMVPGLNDQPFGEVARGGFVEALRAADPGGVVHVGYPRRRHTIADNDVRASSGRLRLQADLPATGGIEQPILLGPRSRVPSLPFWLSIDGELMWVHRPSIAPSPDPARIVVLLADRGADTRLISGRPPEAGTSLRAHSAGAAATVVDVTFIYVHTKMIIIDDVFLGVGSANLNRRGYCHDGEMNIYVVPEALKGDPENAVARLRRRLWAEALDLPLAAAEPLLQEPVAAATLFGRSPFAGNRFVEIDALPKHIMFGSESIGGVFSQVIQGLLASFAAASETQVFNTFSDPSSAMCAD